MGEGVIFIVDVVGSVVNIGCGIGDIGIGGGGVVVGVLGVFIGCDIDLVFVDVVGDVEVFLKCEVNYCVEVGFYVVGGDV